MGPSSTRIPEHQHPCKSHPAKSTQTLSTHMREETPHERKTSTRSTHKTRSSPRSTLRGVMRVREKWDVSPFRNNAAKTSRPFFANRKDKEEIARLVQQRILTLEKEMLATKSEPFHDKDNKTENLKGEFDKDLEKYENRPKLKALLLKHKEIFGPLQVLERVANLCKWIWS